MNCKKIRYYTIFLLMVVCASVTVQAEPWKDIPRPPEDYQYQQLGLDNKPERVEWLKDAGFGMFIHFGVDSQLGSVISHSLIGASDDYVNRFYNELPKTFNPKRFDPEEMATLAKLAGMKYVVLGTKHHSGFCMWDTKTTNFNIMNTPYGRDLLAEYVAAVRKVGLAVGLYYSPEDWSFVLSQGYMPRRLATTIPQRNKAYCDYIQTQCTELMTHYGKIDVMFLDGAGDLVARDTCWKLQPDLLITRGAISTPEQTFPSVIMPDVWEACITIGTQWQFKPTNESYKTGTRLIEMLIDIRSKNGVFLLNFGPQPDGVLPFEQERLLREIALWNFVNGEAVHDVRPWIVPNENNIWFTKHKNSDTVYAFVTQIPDWPRSERKEFILKTVKASPDTDISVLGQSGLWIEYNEHKDPQVHWSQQNDGLHVSMVRGQRLYNDHKWPNAPVMKITHAQPALKVIPQVETLELTQLEPDIVLPGKVINLGGEENVRVGFQYRLKTPAVDNLEDDRWTHTIFLNNNKGMGEYQISLKENLIPGQRYQYRAILQHPLVTVNGVIEPFKVPNP